MRALSLSLSLYSRITTLEINILLFISHCSQLTLIYNVRHFLPPVIHHLFLPGQHVVVLALPGVVLVVALLAGAGPPVAHLLRLVVAGLVVTVGP